MHDRVLHSPRRFLIPALAFAILGLTTTFSRWPSLRAAQVLMPFVSGVATGLLIGRFLRESRALRATA